MVTRQRNAGRSGFTLVELLIAISIIAILAGLLITTLGNAGDLAKRTQTDTILSTIAIGLASQARSGSSASPTEHPLAGSKATRAAFVYEGAALDTGSEGLVVRDRSWVSAATRVLDPDDRYAELSADGAAPHLFGMPRRYIGVLGPGRAEVTLHRRLPGVDSRWGQDSNNDGTRDSLRSPYSSDTYPDFQFLVAPQTAIDDIDDASERSLRFALGDAYDELLSIDGIQHNAGTAVLSDRVITPDQRPKGVSATYDDWAPSTTLIGGNWTFYRLPGAALYDAWGNEILVGSGGGGGIVLTSAGEDGSFRVDPGPNGVFDSDPMLADLSGDDRDGAKDNLIVSSDSDALLEDAP